MSPAAHRQFRLTLATQGAVQAVPISPVPISPNQFLFRSDVKSYYASIDHAVLLTLVRDRIDNWRVLDLVAQYLGRTIDENCLYATVTRGISLGCPLSPVMAALYLEPLDSPHGGHRSLLRSLHGRLGDPGHTHWSLRHLSGGLRSSGIGSPRRA